MSAPLLRIQQLLALASDAAASPEEARTAALIAAKLIRSSGLQLAPPGPPPVAPTPAPAGRQRKANDRPPGAYRMSSKFPSWCGLCGGQYRVGDMIWWVPGRKGAIHFVCPVNTLPHIKTSNNIHITWTRSTVTFTTGENQ